MKSCEQIRARSWAHLDGEVDPAEAAEVSSHLERCPECARAFEARRAFLETVALARAETAPPGLRSRVESILDPAIGPADRAAGDREPGDHDPADHTAGDLDVTDRETAAAAAAAGRGSWVPGRWIALPIAAVLAALLLFRPWAGPSPEVVLAARGFVADHAAHALDQPAARPFLIGEEPPPDPPALAAGRALGLSRCVVEGRVYAHYVYAVDGATVSAFVPVRGALPGEADGGLAIDGHGVVTARTRDDGVVLVSGELSTESLSELSPGA